MYQDDGGSIWSSGSIFFASQSAINDILEKEEFTLNEVLSEEDLLQELKGLNVKLLEYISSEKTLTKILDYMTDPESIIDGDELQKRRFPFLACEIFLCDVSQITSTTTSWQENGLLKRLLSVLDSKELSSQSCGYFSRVFQLLCRRHPKSMIKYFEAHGPSVMKPFLNHVGSYSIMESLQCIINLNVEMMMMNHTGDDEDEEEEEEKEEEEGDTNKTPKEKKDDSDVDENADKKTTEESSSSSQSSSTKPKEWLQSNIVIDELLQCIRDSTDPDVHENIGLLLCSICGNEMLPRNDALLEHLESESSCTKLLSMICENHGENRDEEVKTDDSSGVFKKNSSSDSVNSRRLAVLDVVIHLLDAFMMKQQQPEQHDDMSGMFGVDVPDQSTNKIELASTQPPILLSLCKNAEGIRNLLGNKDYQVQKQSDGVIRPRLGRDRRLLVNLVSNVVIMASLVFASECRQSVCDAVKKSGFVPLCFELFFIFDRCNILHNQVITMLMHIVSRDHMEPIASSLFAEFNLLNRVLAEYDVNEKLLERKDRKESSAKGNFGHLHKLSNIIVEASQLPLKDKNCDSVDVMASPPSLLSAVKSNEKWVEFVDVVLKKINKDAGASTPQTPGMDSIASPDNDFGNDVADDDWHLHDMNEDDDEDDDTESKDLGDMLQRARLDETGADHNGGDGSSSSDEESGDGKGSQLQVQISDEDSGNGDDDEDFEAWANFGDFDDNVDSGDNSKNVDSGDK